MPCATAAVSVARRMISIIAEPPFLTDDAIFGEHAASCDKNQNGALDHLHRRDRQPELLDGIAAHQQTAEQERHHDGGQRMALRQIRDGHTRRAELRGKICLQAVCDAANLNHARNAGDTGTEEHHQQDVPVDGHACITCDLFLCADELDFKAPTRFIDDKPQSQRNHKADDQAGVDARAEKGCQLARRRDLSRAPGRQSLSGPSTAPE